MCRLLLGVNFPVDKTLLKKFLAQSNTIKYTPGFNNYLDADFHLDGYGFAFGKFGDKLQITKTQKSWEQDPSLNQKLETIIKSKPEIIIGHIRNKGKCEGEKDINNTHPFTFNNFVMVHNGFIKNFNSNKNKILDAIDSKYFDEIKGSTDTEHIFYLLLSAIDLYLDYYIEDGYPRTTIYLWSFITVFEYLIKISVELVGNFIFSDGDNIIVIRYVGSNFSDSKIPPSLYLGINDNSERFIISSEPLTPYYELFPENSYMII